MQCNVCREPLAPTADVCPICESPAPSPLGSPAPGISASRGRKKERKDISQLTCLLISLPMLAVDGLRLVGVAKGNVPYALGQVLGHALIATLVAALIGQVAKTRFRVTWLATFAVVVLIMYIQALGSLPTTPAPVSSAPLTVPTIAWPAGWTPSPATPVAEMHGVQQTAILIKNGRRAASLTLMLWRQGGTLSLATEVNAVIKGESEMVTKKGMQGSFTTPVESTWLGRPALQYDGSVQSVVHIHQRSVVTQGSSLISCSVVYSAADDEFEQHLSDFEATRSQFVCPHE